jgi:hypothetical protein
MKITRRGARADNGPSSIELTNTKVSFKGENLIIRDTDISDFVTKAHYNYTIEISLDEVANIIDSLGSSSEEEKRQIGKALEPKLKHLLRIVQSCIGA